ncbi:uncharacterized protein LOC102081596 isoform X2 [Oreochromis niloticus]|uniref:uncharacterized protein LOC102081596 isoform X2 n=1 Tax=Oreochromis niloticus TaxID=8128 RepID=UPI00090499F5|nr:uncharacterized protein LOC102081596 isoform X2 [Oreochromis niloticus]
MSDKLSVTANCSLVIKEVTHEDAGSYTCIQFISGKNVTDYQVDLFVITMVPQQISEIKVRLGGEVHLSCKNSNTFQDNCLSTRWLFNSSGSRPVETLFENGHVLKADRLSITDDCSLVIKKVTSEDAGLYACRQLVFGLMDDFTDYLLHLAVANGCWVKFIVVIVGLAALSVTVVSVNIWTKTKGYKSSPAKTDHNETNDGEIYYEIEDRPA